MIKYILAGLLVAGVWVLWAVGRFADSESLLVSLPLWVPIAVTATVIALFVAAYAVRKIKARRAAKEIEKVLAEQAHAQIGSTNPEKRAEIEAMQREFERAVKSLRSSKLGQSGFGALYSLPWYVLIGPPGGGKTTALRASGLRFPYLSGEKGAVKGIGGTRNCDWWFTNEAVLLDTAGRYTTGEEDRDEWFAFLDMLRSNRTKKPIDGVMVAISVESLGKGDAAAAANEARRVRERIDELMSRLDMVVPIYVVFTKCDLIQGFMETFGALKKADRKNG